ncbi:hypothetical protein B382_19735 [Stutzerimonas stutzeri B1SMN1]|jgi:hypothetical protein|nr:hypothetical protein B382_19735 [Stutzerimonas stutzeri B1SMN1]
MGMTDNLLLVVEYFELAEKGYFAQMSLIRSDVLKLPQDFLSQIESLILRDDQTNKVGIVGLLGNNLVAFAYGEFVILGSHAGSFV